jgi:hypothetical protein
MAPERSAEYLAVERFAKDIGRSLFWTIAWLRGVLMELSSNDKWTRCEVVCRAGGAAKSAIN